MQRRRRSAVRNEGFSAAVSMLEQAIELVIAEGDASASLIQRRLGIGYPRAARIMDMLLELGLVGELKADRRSREVLVMPGEDPFRNIIDQRLQKRRRPGAPADDEDDALDPDGDVEGEDWSDDEDADLS